MPTLEELLNIQNQQLDEINSLLNEEFMILKNKKALALPEIETKKAAVIDKIQKLDRPTRTAIFLKPNIKIRKIKFSKS